MNIEEKLKSINLQPEFLKVEEEKPHAKTQINNSEGLIFRDLETKKSEAQKQDEANIAEIRASLGLEQALELEQNEIKQYLQEYLNLKKGAVEGIGLLKAKDLPKNYQTQRETFYDERLDRVTIAVVPDDLWVKGSQPSESNAERQLILIKQSYFNTQENSDEIAWLCHELAHCQNFLDSTSPEEYQDNMQRFAFEDIKTEYTYPNNLVEQFAFTKQFQYLKEQGKNRQDVLTIISKYYHKEDFPFFNRLLDDVYGK